MNKEVLEQPKTLFNSAAKVVGMNITHQAFEVLKMWCTESRYEVRDMELLAIEAAELFDSLIPRFLHDAVTNEALEYLASRFKWVFEVIRDNCGFSSFMLECHDFDSYESEIYSALYSAILIGRLKYVHTNLNFLGICLRSHLSKLHYYEWPDEMHDALFKSLIRLKKLKHLKLSGTNVFRNSTYVNRAIKEMKCLESFKCLGCPTNTLEILCDNCPLRRLNIKYAQHINDTSLTSVLKLKNLQKLNILITGFSETSITKILRGLPKLTSIHTGDLLSSLAQIGDTNEIFPLQHVRISHPTLKDLVNLAKHCPFITKLEICGGNTMDFTSLVALKHLENLRFYFIDLLFEDIKSLLQLIGHKIIKLNIDRLDDSSTTALQAIKALCPNLEEFVFHSKEI